MIDSIYFTDIIGRVRNRETTPCRPGIFADATELRMNNKVELIAYFSIV